MILLKSVKRLSSLNNSLLFSRNTRIASKIAHSFSNLNNDDNQNQIPDGFEKYKRKSKTKKQESAQSDAPKQEVVRNDEQESQKKDEGEKVMKDRNERIKESTRKVEEIIKQVNKEQEQLTQKNQEGKKEDEENKKDQNTWPMESFSNFTKNMGKKINEKYEKEEKEEKNEQSNNEQSNNNSHNQHQHHHKQEQSEFRKKINEFLKKGNNKIYVTAAVAIAIIGPAWYYQHESSLYISYMTFVRTYLQLDQVKSIQIQRVQVGGNLKIFAQITLKDGTTKKLVLGNVDHFLEQIEEYQTEKGRDSEGLIPITFEYLSDFNKGMDNLLSYASKFGSIFIAYLFFKSMRSGMGGMKGGGGGGDLFGMGKSNVKVFGTDSKVKTRFKDVAGQDEAKLEIQEFVDFLKKPTKYKAIGAKLPRGALLTGPPGTGKTLLAKACAGEAGVPFFFISGSDFVEMFVGVGASRVRDLFKQAKEKSPSIIFIDEIDAVGRKRDNKMGGNDERDNTLNQLLVEMDGFGTDANVIILAATNRKELLDPALTRPGRFDRQIEVTNPDIDGRKQIFMVHLKPLKVHPSKTLDEYAKRLATLTPGFSGADIMNLCNEAAIMAARGNKKYIESIDFELASERVIAGLEKKRIVSEEERKIVAVHESGHAVTSWFLEGGHPLLKLTIIPRTKGSLGFAQYLPNESTLESKDELLDRLCTILGGRCAEEEFFGKITTGAYDDLKRAYELCHALVTKYGMSEKLGYIGYTENDYSKSYSSETNLLIDNEIMRLIEEGTQKTRDLIKQYRPQIESLSNTLLEKETLDLRQITKILGNRPFPPKSNYKAYLEIQNQEDKEKQSESSTTQAAEIKMESIQKQANQSA